MIFLITLSKYSVIFIYEGFILYALLYYIVGGLKIPQSNRTNHIFIYSKFILHFSDVDCRKVATSFSLLNGLKLKESPFQCG